MIINDDTYSSVETQESIHLLRTQNKKNQAEPL